jgi:hypothetical protein
MYEAKGKLGSGERFKKLSEALSKKKGVSDPKALAAVLGRRNNSAGKLASLAAKGKKESA